MRLSTESIVCSTFSATVDAAFPAMPVANETTVTRALSAVLLLVSRIVSLLISMLLAVVSEAIVAILSALAEVASVSSFQSVTARELLRDIKFILST